MEIINEDGLIEELVKLYDEMLENNLPINQNFYKRLYNIMNSIFHIEPEYLKDLVLINFDNIDNPENKRYAEGIEALFARAGYDSIERKLVIYEDNIEAMLPDPEEESSKEHFTKVFCMVLQTILHEYEHIFQHIIMDKKDTQEAKFLRITHQTEETLQGYSLRPSERLAEINSNEKILAFLEAIGLTDSKLFEYYENKNNSILKSGYYFEDENGNETTKEKGTFTSPSGRYVRISGIDPEEFFEITSEIEDPKTRLKYGVSLSEQEYYEVLDKFSCSRK